MGVPAFFKWLCIRNPKILWEVQENQLDSEMSVNPDIDNLYLDMNCIIHPCSHPEQSGIPVPVTLQDMFVNIFNYVDRLMNLIRPNKVLYLAVDGVAPRAKMNQQRARRFRAAQESERAQNEKVKLKEFWRGQGIDNPSIDDYINNSFDSNQITPGTEFMESLTIAIQFYIYDRLNNDPIFKNLTVIFSDASVPGEGEHKILQFIREQRSSVGYNPNTQHCLFGADADLIMLGLSTHEPWFYILRETIVQNEDKFCSICQQRGHYFSDCRANQRGNDIVDEMEVNLDDANKKIRVGKIQIDFQMIKLYVVREWIWLEFSQLVQTAPRYVMDLEKFVDDFMFLCFFVGNDFLPHIPGLRITEGGIDCLMILYKINFPKTGYLTNNGNINLDTLNEFLLLVGAVEDELLLGQQRKMENIRNRKEYEEQRNNNDQQQGVKTNLVTGERTFQSVPINTEVSELLTKFKQQIKDRLKEVSQIEMSAGQALQNANQMQQWQYLSLRQRYYTEKFQIQPKEFQEFRDKIRLSYIEGLCWTLKYYCTGCIDWGWYYPFHYAPFAQDLVNCEHLSIEFKENNQPFLPYQQLLGVLPPRSKQFLPELFQTLMIESSSPIADFYPCDFYVDLKGKKFAWLGEVVLPFIDADRLVKAHNNQLTKGELTLKQRSRNSFGNELLFYNSSENQIKQEKQSKLIIGYVVKYWDRFPIGSKITSPMTTFPDIQDNQVVSEIVVSKNHIKVEGFLFNTIIQGCIQPQLTLDQYYMNECENNLRPFSGEVVKRIIYQSLGIQLPKESYHRPQSQQRQYSKPPQQLHFEQRQQQKRKGLDLSELDLLQKHANIQQQLPWKNQQNSKDKQ